MFFNNCRLTNLSLIQFEIKPFEQVARCLNQWKNTNGFRNNRLITLPGAGFLCLRQNIVSLIFQTVNTDECRLRILLSFMRQIDEYLVALKDFGYSCSL